MCERVLEEVRQLRVNRLLQDQLERPQLVDDSVYGLAGVADPLQEPQREVAPDHRRHLDGTLGLIRKSIQPGHQHALDAVRNADVGELGLELEHALA